MRTRSLPLLCAGVCCSGWGPHRQAPAPTHGPGNASATAEPAARYDFKVLPVTEEGIRTLYGWEGYEVRRITPFEEDYLVEYDPNDGAGTFTLLSWVFGNTGRRVQLCGMTEFTSYEITGPGQVRLQHLRPGRGHALEGPAGDPRRPGAGGRKRTGIPPFY